MRYTEFGSLTLQQIDAEDVLDPQPSVDPMIETASGPYDVFGSKRVFGRYVVSKAVTVHNATSGGLDTDLDTLRSYEGKQDTLVAEMADLSERSAIARLLRISTARTRRNFNFQPVVLTWEIMTSWYGGLNQNNEAMASSPHSITAAFCANAGNKADKNAIFAITAGAAAITAITLAKSGSSDIDWTGTVTAGQAIVFDCGQRTVKNNGVDAFSGFSFGGSHVIDDWIVLEPGANAITVTFTGGSTNSDVKVSRRDYFY